MKAKYNLTKESCEEKLSRDGAHVDGKVSTNRL